MTNIEQEVTVMWDKHLNNHKDFTKEIILHDLSYLSVSNPHLLAVAYILCCVLCKHPCKINEGELPDRFFDAVKCLAREGDVISLYDSGWTEEEGDDDLQ